MANKYNFNDKVALITGSSHGIGAAIAIQFALNGANVTITGRDSKALDSVAEEIFLKTNRQPLKILGDLFDEMMAQKLIEETVHTFGRLDILVNNAGTGFEPDSIDNENILKEFDRLMLINVRVPFQLIIMAQKYLQQTNGNIINISSNASLEPILFTYSISKAALDMLTKCVAQELGPKGVRVNSINPGPTITSMGRALGHDEDHFERSKDIFKKVTILDRCAYPNEMASLALFLASDEAKNITGSIIVSDGGMLIKKRCHFG